MSEPGDRYRAEMEGLALALRGTSDGVAIVDLLGRIVFANPALATALERSEPALVGRLLEDLVVLPAGDATLDDVLSAVAEQGRWS
ncbi:MAG TPA: PAS domain-containing protein, partial [Candidatus Binatia bacterium]|nr:PAS domain-containing protein [Candidatus Binatia bacterium]